jgi:hypothetical protein
LFILTKKDSAAEDVVVSYHESTEQDDIIEDEDIIKDADSNIDNDINGDTPDDIKTTEEESHNNHATFNATVMALVINEATTEADEDIFIGASFAQLQEVDDVYEDNEPDIVCCAHVVDLENDNGVDVPEFVMDANNNADEHNRRVSTHYTNTDTSSHFLKDFELMVYHTAQRVMHKRSTNVSIFHYVPGHPEFISHEYGPNIPESIVDYSDVLRFKLKKAGIHDTTTLVSILSNRTDIDAMAALKLKFNAVGLKGINTSTVKILREETDRNRQHWEHNNHRYHTMEMEIGVDAMMQTFPTDNTLLHYVVSCVAINQDRRKPNRWVNKITQKLIDSGITSIEELESKIGDATLNECLDSHSMPRLHAITINGFTHIIGNRDFH